MRKGEKILIFSVVTFAGLYFLFVGLAHAEPFLVPLLTAMVMAFLMLPITSKFEQWGFPKALATLSSTMILVFVTLGFMAIVFFQVRSFNDDWDQIQKNLGERIEQITNYLIEYTPLEDKHIGGFSLESQESGQQQQEAANEQDPQGLQSNQQEGSQTKAEETGEGIEGAGQAALSVLSALLDFITDFLITFVYVFLFIHFRQRFKTFILRFFPREKRNQVAGIISRSSSVSRAYLAGRLLLMIVLSVLYYIGLAISGLENAFLIALLSAALSIIPFVGNFIGYSIAVAVSMLTDGDGTTILGITITFIVAQFIDTYILQPIVLGGKVNVHPFFIIVSVILGYEVWGIMGMVLAIPLFGMITVVCRHVPALNPFGYLFSNKDISEPEEAGKIIIENK